MQTTTNYGLKTYEAGDLFNPLTTDNVNMQTIDTDLKAVSNRAIGRATELVSQGVHAITVLDTDCKTIKWVATANFTAGETFTINGIQCNAYLPSGEALGTNAFVSGAQVIGSLNDDNSAITIYVPQGSVAVASDSEKLGGELPSYYATKTYADGIKSTADTASNLIQKKALVNTYYDSSSKKLYQIKNDGTVGGEILMSKVLDFAHKVNIANTTYTTTKAGIFYFSMPTNIAGNVTIDGESIFNSNTAPSSATHPDMAFPLDAGAVIYSSYGAPTTKAGYSYFVPYK